ncbi:MAG: YggS family pyridoxal phosphate-dependent enzyme [Endomicrobium sp.]|jgi:pyridoxal phosphate enzyme (YggS family)|nr:YggS family pyridoxal phosphate-dependent enzyme [Endomicrobium sp.]
MKENIYQNINFIKNFINKNKKFSNKIELVVVTKTFPSYSVTKSLDCGIKHIAESRLQEALPKFKQLGASINGVTKHFIGHLQSNKIKKIVENFDFIQSLDDLEKASSIGYHAKKKGKIQNCLIEVKISHEITKTGVEPENLKNFYKKCKLINGILIKGLMIIAPNNYNNPEELRPFFKLTRYLFEKIKISDNHANFNILSMGMSNDYKIAIEEGSNMIRIGSAIFGK